MKPLQLNLDIKNNSYEELTLMQGYTYPLEATLADGGQAFDLTGQVITIELLKADNTFIIQSEGITTKGNVVIALLHNDFTRISGMGKLQVVARKDNLVTGSWVVNARIKEAAINKAIGESGNIVTIKETLDQSILEAIEENKKTEQLIQSGGAASKGDIIEINSQLDNTIQQVNTINTNKVDKVNGKGLSTNDYDNMEKAEVEKIKNKADTNYVDTKVFSMANMGQDVKEAMTGGSVAVVGKDTVLTENIVDNQVTISKCNFPYVEKIENISHRYPFKNILNVEKTFINQTSSAINLMPDNYSSCKTQLDVGVYFAIVKFSITNITNVNSGATFLPQLRETTTNRPQGGQGIGISPQAIYDGVNDIIDFTSYTMFKVDTSAEYHLSIYANRLGSNNKSLTVNIKDCFMIKTNLSEMPTSNSNDYLKFYEMYTTYGFLDYYPSNFLFTKSFYDNIKNEIGVGGEIVFDSIDCIGDSLTAGTDGFSYVDELKTLLPQKTIKNYGSGGESANTISARCGGLQLMIEPTTISTEYTNCTILDNRGDVVNLRTSINGTTTLESIKPLYINGTEVDLQYGDIPYQNPYKIKATKQIVINRPTMIKTNFMNLDKTGHIALICIGQNAGYWTDMDLCYQIDNIIKQNNYQKYLILPLSVPSGTINKRLQEWFGRNFVDVRTYMIKYGLQDLGLTATSQDNTAIEQGKVPPSLMFDSVHYTKEVNKNIVAKYIHIRGIELGYW